MASPFVHNPGPSSYPAFQPTNYYDSLIYGGQKYQYSPFVPPTPLALPGTYSPFSAALSIPLPPSPHLGAVPFPGGGGGDGSALVSNDWTGYPHPTRQRTTSWHAAPTPGGGYSPGFLSAGLPPTSGHYRSHSFGAGGGHHGGGGIIWPPQTTPLTPPQIPMSLLQYRLHPWLNGESPRNDFRFDLSSAWCVPQRLVVDSTQTGTGMWLFLGQKELMGQATDPAVTKLRIVCDIIPQWPIELVPLSTTSTPLDPLPPLLLGDVLVMIHRSLQTRISHNDWAKLNPVQEMQVTRAFMHRCSVFGPNANEEKKNGVRRVDFLVGKVWFRGLVPTTEPGVLKMVLA